MNTKTLLAISLAAIMSIVIVTNVNVAEAQSSEPTVKTIKIVNNYANEGRLETDPRTSNYNYVFEACAGNKMIRTPEVIISSDSEVKQIKLANSLSANSCDISVAKIHATDKSTIKAQIVNKGGLSKIVVELESKVSELKVALSNENAAFKALIKKSPQPENFQEQVKKSTDKIVDLRKQLKDARAELYRTMYVLTK